jgi:DGQHR domain-containing protein
MMELVDPDYIIYSIDALRVTQPIGDFFTAAISHTTLSKISYFDVRRVLRDERDFERYLGIQRPLNDRRVKDLEKYVNFLDSTFPSSIIIAVDAEYASYNESDKILTLRNFREGEEKPSIAISALARVLDGQHRIAGLAAFKGPSFDLPVTIFVGSDIADQAYIFSTVNLEQTKVSKSLVYDLFELAKTRSPQKTCHNIAIALDHDVNSPFYLRIKRLGFADLERSFQTITQATFVESLIHLISKDPKTDRDRLMRGQRLDKIDLKDDPRLVFRRSFIEERDISIAHNVDHFFAAVRERWPIAWGNRGQGSVLNKTNGFRALMRILPRAYSYFGVDRDVIQAGRFLELFKRVAVDDDYFTVERFSPGTSGETELFRFFSGKVFE